MNIVKEFKEFATKGTFMDMAIGVIIGAAIGKIVASLVADILMPPIGLIISDLRFTDIVIPLRQAITNPNTGAIVKEAVNVKLGSFIQTLFDFLIIASAIFMMIKTMNRINLRKASTEPPKPSKEEILLTEIRDLLKNKEH